MIYSPPLRNYLKNQQPMTAKKILRLNKLWVEFDMMYAIFELEGGKFKKVKKLSNIMDYLELMYWQAR